MKRICLFAGYHAGGRISDYVVYYIKSLSEISDVYYMADCEMRELELQKIKPYLKWAGSFRHKKYDFGSWQELMERIGWDKISEYDELILCNDSCFGPLFPLSGFFDAGTSDKQCDYWGLTKDYAKDTGVWYIQSYFMVFKRNVVMSSAFRRFFAGIRIEDSVTDVVNRYEFPLSDYLRKEGFHGKCFMDNTFDIYSEGWRKCIKNGYPFIKIKLFVKDSFKYRLYGFKSFIRKYSEYDTRLISEHLYSIGAFKSSFNYFLNWKNILFRLNNVRKWFVQIRFHKKVRIIRFLGIYFLNDNIDKQHYKVEDDSIGIIKMPVFK